MMGLSESVGQHEVKRGTVNLPAVSVLQHIFTNQRIPMRIIMVSGQ